MTRHPDGLVHHKTVFDDWRSLTIAIYMALVGYAVMVGMPVISTSWVDNLGFTEIEKLVDGEGGGQRGRADRAGFRRSSR